MKRDLNVTDALVEDATRSKDPTRGSWPYY